MGRILVSKEFEKLTTAEALVNTLNDSGVPLAQIHLRINEDPDDDAKLQMEYWRDETPEEIEYKKNQRTRNLQASENAERIQLRMLMSKYPDEWNKEYKG